MFNAYSPPYSVHNDTDIEDEEQTSTSPIGPQQIDRIINFRKKDDKRSFYLVRWRDSHVARDQLNSAAEEGSSLLNQVFKLRPHGKLKQNQFSRIGLDFMATDDYYIVKWRDTWKLDAELFTHGALLHQFWSENYIARRSGLTTSWRKARSR